MRPSQSSTPGAWFRRHTERWFDRRTVELIVLPAIADLQRECNPAHGRAWLTRVRAYIGVWKVIAVCALGQLSIEAGATLSLLAGRMAIALLIVSAILWAAGIPYLVTITRELGLQAALRASVLVLPGALFGALPIAFFGAVVLLTRAIVNPRRLQLIPGVMAGAVASVSLSFALTLITPSANEAYHDTLERALSLSNKTTVTFFTFNDSGWRELVESVRHPHDKRGKRIARAALHQRIAWPLGALSLGLLAVALANRARSGTAAFVTGAVGLIVYMATFYTGALLALLDDGMMIGVWAPTLVTLALAAVFACMPARRPVMAPR